MKLIKLLFSVPFLFFVFLSNVNSQTYLEKDLKDLINANSKSDVDNFVLDKIIKNRVVMIADEDHGNHIFMNTVIESINCWIDSILTNSNTEKNIPKKLYLILENDSNQINSIYKYFLSNNPYELLNPSFIIGYQFTSAMIEFYDDLRKINCRIDSINNNLPDKSKISFKLFGPEKVINLNSWSNEKGDDFFVHERDEYSSNQIIDLLEKDSTAKALIFYGGAHLATTKTQKPSKNKEQGYYIGYYLLEHFKNKGGFYSIDQISVELNTWLNECYKCSDNNYAIENSIFNGCPIPNNMQPQFTSASIILFNKTVKQFHISQIWSNNLIDCFINNANKFSYLKGDFIRMVISSWLYYFSIISGNEMENIDINDSVSVAKEIDKWTNWRKNKKENIAEEIISQNIIKRRIALFEKSEYPIASRYEYELGNRLLNAKVWGTFESLPKDKAKEYYNYIQIYSKPIIAENLINLLWVGTNEERQIAIDFLKQTFSEKFNTAKEWSEWWRNSEYCN
ncbi:MAG: hypothetical protein V1773_04860 [bacterium]